MEGCQIVHNRGENVIYSINNNIVKTFKHIKVLYLCGLVSFTSVVLLYDDNHYSSDLVAITYTYLFFELISLFVYIFKINSRRHLKFLRFMYSILRMVWLFWTIYGLNEWFSEKETRDSLLFYLTAFIYFSNVIYVLLTISIMCFGFRFIIVNRDGDSHIDGDNDSDSIIEDSISRRRTLMSIINDNSDIQLFSNITGIKNESMCSICFEDFQNDDSVRILPCEHYYHDNCINEWFQKSGTCPICRFDLVENTISV